MPVQTSSILFSSVRLKLLLQMNRRGRANKHRTKRQSKARPPAQRKTMLEWLLLLLALTEGMIDHHIIDDTSISTGIEHTCAVHLLSEADFGGRVLCWGSNGQGQSSPPKVTCAVRQDPHFP